MNVIYKTVTTVYTVFSLKQSLFTLGKIRNFKDQVNCNITRDINLTTVKKHFKSDTVLLY